MSGAPTRFEGVYAGALYREYDVGGTCRLALAAGTFDLQIDAGNSHWDIDEGRALQGAWLAGKGGLTLLTDGEHGPPRELFAAFAGPEDDPFRVLEMAIFRRSPVLLLATNASAATKAWYHAEWSRRDAALDDANRVRLQRERIASAEEAFRARDYRRVVMILGAMEQRLSPAERRKLGIARRKLG